MTSFAGWLRARAMANPEDPDLQALKAFAETNAASWPYWSDQRSDFQKIIEDAPDTADKSKLIATLAENYRRWKAEESIPSRSGNWGFQYFQSFGDWLSNNISVLALIGFGVAIAFGMYYGLFKNSAFYVSLKDTDQARGLITFLFVLSTSAVILLTAIAIFWMDKGEDLKDRFAFAKDLITIVVGILGTIMGFYFGLQKLESGNGGPATEQHGQQNTKKSPAAGEAPPMKQGP